jgi:polyphenol oxidase
LRPDWTVDGVGGLMSTRQGGTSAGPFESFNLRGGLGDDDASVANNQAVFAAAIGVVPVWLNQVHGTTVVRLRAADASPGASVHTADASVTTEHGIACTAQVADCLPVLFAAPGGRAVGAAHAGWRGLAAGVLDATVLAVCEASGCDSAELQVWMGACIGPSRFEVGRDVLDAFDVSATSSSARFTPRSATKWNADLPGLARDRLVGAGVVSITGGRWCTVSEPSRFFSYRRDRITGRMAAAVWIDRR